MAVKMVSPENVIPEAKMTRAERVGEPRIIHNCLLCDDADEILMATRKGALMPEHNTRLFDVCDACKEKYLSVGVLLINPHNGGLVVIKDEAFLRIFDTELPEKKVCFVEQAILDWLNGKAPLVEKEDDEKDV